MPASPAVTPDRDTFVRLAAEATLVPVVQQLLADTETPVSLFTRLRDEPGAFLLESVQGGERWASHSYIGLDPFQVLTAHGDRCVLQRDGQTETRTGNPVQLLRALLAEQTAATVEGLPRFAGGAVGFFGYDVVRWVERIPTHIQADTDVPDAAWVIPGSLLVFDNLSHRLQLVRLARTGDGIDPGQAYDRAVADLARLRERLRTPAAPPLPATTPDIDAEPEWRADRTQADFEDAVDRAKEHIRSGDVFQLVLSQRFAARTHATPWDVYRALRVVNPSPYMYFLNLPGVKVVGASPELLFRVEGRDLTVRPIAGTRPRGRNPAEDAALEAELRADPKEVAEHVMLIDLGRNDVGRVAEMGSVRLVDRMVVERYSHVMHLVSSVTGTLRVGCDAFDAFASAFPAGTLTGAPKVRAMQLIEEMEPTRRGVYGGAVGYFGFDGAADLAIAIRTLIATPDGELTFQAGAGIVYDSDPRAEYQETLHKSGALRRAIKLAHRGLDVL